MIDFRIITASTYDVVAHRPDRLGRSFADLANPIEDRCGGRELISDRGEICRKVMTILYRYYSNIMLTSDECTRHQVNGSG